MSVIKKLAFQNRVLIHSQNGRERIDKLNRCLSICVHSHILGTIKHFYVILNYILELACGLYWSFNIRMCYGHIDLNVQENKLAELNLIGHLSQRSKLVKNVKKFQIIVNLCIILWFDLFLPFLTTLKMYLSLFSKPIGFSEYVNPIRLKIR